VGFSEAQLDKWANWLETETSYSVGKFPTSEQLRYFDIGVARGDFSFEMSALGYFKRAVLKAGILSVGQAVALRAVQEVGKSAHNHLACAATARVAFGQAPSFMGSMFDTVDEWRGRLATQDIKSLPLTLATIDELSLGFATTQQLQDEANTAEFTRVLAGVALPVQATFIDLAETYGWPQPGISSSEDIRTAEPHEFSV